MEELSFSKGFKSCAAMVNGKPIIELHNNGDKALVACNVCLESMETELTVEGAIEGAIWGAVHTKNCGNAIYRQDISWSEERDG